MRKLALLAGAITAFALPVHADFIFRENTSVIAGTGPFAGDDMQELQIQAIAGTRQSTNLVAYQVSMTSFAASPKFYIRTWNEAEGFYDDVTPANNTDADFGNRGVIEVSDQVSPRQGPKGSSVRVGPIANFILAASTPGETSVVFNDYQAVSSLTVQAASSHIDPDPLLSGVAVSTNPTVWVTIATAVVPPRQQVTFVARTWSTLPSDVNGVLYVPPLEPEPAGLGVLGAGILLACRRRA